MKQDIRIKLISGLPEGHYHVTIRGYMHVTCQDGKHGKAIISLGNMAKECVLFDGIFPIPKREKPFVTHDGFVAHNCESNFENLMRNCQVNGTAIIKADENGEIFLCAKTNYADFKVESVRIYPFDKPSSDSAGLLYMLNLEITERAKEYLFGHDKKTEIDLKVKYGI